MTQVIERLATLVQPHGQLAAFRDSQQDGFVVLVQLGAAGNRWATWRCSTTACFWGHYFTDAEEAQQDYEERL